MKQQSKIQGSSKSLRRKSFAISLCLGFMLLVACSAKKDVSFKKVSLQIAGNQLEIELALQPEQHARGLMFRKSMEEMHGMLFSFKQDRVMHFYMKNTLIPLSIAYLDAEGVIREIYDMQPLDETTTESQWPRRYALEMNQGWFERHSVGIGEQLLFSDGSPISRLALREKAR